MSTTEQQLKEWWEQQASPYIRSVDAGARIATALEKLAAAIEHLADTQEKPVVSVSKPVSFSIAHYEDPPDAQTESLRELSRKRDSESV